MRFLWIELLVRRKDFMVEVVVFSFASTLLIGVW
jgi:hypothetical protein